MSTPASNSALGTYVGVVQFFFATTWTLYVIYLPQLAQQAGIGKQWVPWILVADQVIFAIADVVTGFWIDRVRAGFARLGGWIMGITMLSGAAFLALPYFSFTPALLIGAIVVWAITSSALRSPPWALLARHAAQPSMPWLAALVLAGSALAAAIAPYLGIALRGVDPRIPFVVSTLTLLAAVAGLAYAERRAPGVEESRKEEIAEKPARPAPLYLALFLIAVGFQIHFALNSAPRYLHFAPVERLAYLMPVFWIGFNVAMLGAPGIVKRLGALESMALAAAVGTLAIYCATLASSIAALVACELVSGGCWGIASVGAYTAAVASGRTGREGRFLGALFAVLALAAFVRIGAYASGLIVDAAIKAVLGWLPAAAWLSAALLLFATRSR